MDSLFDEDAGAVEYQMKSDILDDEEITQEDAWVVIDKYFLERGSCCSCCSYFSCLSDCP